LIPERRVASRSPAISQRPALDWEGLAHLVVVYAGWSGTYVAIRFAVREGSGFPPFSLVGARLLLAGAVLLAWAAWSHARLKPARNEWVPLVASGILLWGGGNGLVTWAEQRAGAGYAALLVGSTPIWVALLEASLDRRIPSRLFILALLVGFAGVGLLAAPVLSSGARADLLSVIALILAPACWGAGSVLQARRPIAMTPIATAALQHVVGTIFFLAAALAAREPQPMPTVEAWWGWAYLVIVGSVVTFTSFLRALRLLPTSIVMTYSYVNPVGAVLLGWLLLGEAITGWTVAGAALVLLGVAGVFRSRTRVHQGVIQEP
jgi:drug/metabolite transporter (DMT)-like permease